MCGLRQSQDVVERLAAIFLVDEVPERVARNQGVFVAQMVDLLVTARCDTALQLGFLVAVPVACYEGHQAILEPLRDVVAVGTAQLRANRGAVHHLTEQQPHDAFADLCLEMGVVAVKI